MGRKKKMPTRGAQVRTEALRQDMYVRECGKGSHFFMRKKTGETQTCNYGKLSPALRKLMFAFLFGSIIALFVMSMM